MREKIVSELLLLLCALIWGMTFVAQSVATNYIGPGTFQCVRSIIALVVLVPAVFFRKCYRNRNVFSEEKKCEIGKELSAASRKMYSGKKYYELIRGGLLCGLILTIASVLQQEGIRYTSAGNAGFLTAFYLILVPIFSILIGKKIKKRVVFAAFIALLGALFLNVQSSSEDTGYGIMILLLCAVFFAIHIIVIDYFVTLCDPVELSCVQFMFSAVFAGFWMLLSEKVILSQLVYAAIPLLYAGIMSSGVAYTLQIAGQRHVEPSVATLIMSFESVFSMIGGILLLHEKPQGPEFIGCFLLFAAALIAQIPSRKKEGQRI